MKVLWITTPRAGTPPASLPLSSFVESTARFSWQMRENLSLYFEDFVRKTEQDDRELSSMGARSR